MLLHRTKILFIFLLFVVAPTVAQDTVDNPLLRMLRFVPDTPENREYVTYGDAAAWYSSWDVPRIDSIAEIDGLERDPRAYWLNILPRQTTPPDALGLQFMMLDEMRGAYGFDLFNVDRYLQAGLPPDLVSVIEYSFPDSQIVDALIASGYSVETLNDEAALYSILDDYQLDVSMEMVKTRVGQLGNLNRIALLEGQMVIAKATANVTNAFAAHEGDIPSLADDPGYIAATSALLDSALGDMGELVGVIWVDGLQLADPLAYAEFGASQEVVDQIREELITADSALPPYDLVAFGTRHSPGATHLILAVVFPVDTDAKAAANVLAERMENYTSLVTNQPMTDRWDLEMATGTKVNGLPVALVSMRVDDPAPTPDGQELPNAAVFTWSQMVWSRDTLFLATE